MRFRWTSRPHLGSGSDAIAHHDRDQNPFQAVDIAPQPPEVPDIDGIALASLDGGGQTHAADGRLDDLLHIVNGQARSGRPPPA